MSWHCKMGPLTRTSGSCGKNSGSFGNGIYIAGEAEVLQIRQKTFFKKRLPVIARDSGQVLQVVFRKVEMLEKVHGVFQSGRNGKTAAKGVFAKKG